MLSFRAASHTLEWQPLQTLKQQLLDVNSCSERSRCPNCAFENCRGLMLAPWAVVVDQL